MTAPTPDGIIPIPLPLDGRQAVNALLVTGSPLTLVDTGLFRPDSIAALRAALAARGYRLADLEQIVVTHAHLDHFGAAAALLDETRARLLGDADGAAVMADFPARWAGHLAYRLALFRQAGAPPAVIEATQRWGDRHAAQGESVALDRPLRAGDSVSMGGAAWRVLTVPGHAASSIALYQPERQVLLSGDILLGNGASNVTLHQVGDGRLPAGWQLTIVDSLQRLAPLPLRRVYPGHGPRLDNPAATIAERIERVEARLARVRDLLHRPRTAYDLALDLYDAPIAASWVGLSAAIGYVDALEGRDEAVAEEVDGVRRYRRAAENR